jgi:hypothetical protein
MVSQKSSPWPRPARTSPSIPLRSSQVTEDGWERVESCRSHRRCLAPLPPSGSFGPTRTLLQLFCHLTPRCRPTRCFRCLELGHRSSRCLRRLATSKMPRCAAASMMVWPPVSATGTPVNAGSATSTLMCDEERQHQRRSRRRRRHFGRRSSAGSPSSSSSEGRLAPHSANPTLSSLFCSPDDRVKPLCVIDRTASIDRAEADLRRALLVTVGGNRPTVSKFQVLEEGSRVFNIVVNPARGIISPSLVPKASFSPSLDMSADGRCGGSPRRICLMLMSLLLQPSLPCLWRATQDRGRSKPPWMGRSRARLIWR